MIQRLTLDAKSDLREACRWYRRQVPGLDREFLRCFEVCLASVDRYPESQPIVHGRLRRAPLRRFPYAVFYFLRADMLVVVAVLHTYRDPKTLLGRERSPLAE